MREERSQSELSEYAQTLDRLSQQVRAVVGRMQESGLDALLVHGDAAVNRYLPALRKWAGSLEVDCDLQVRSFQRAEKSRAAILKERAAHEAAATKAKKRPAK